MRYGQMPEELCQVSPKSHYVSLALHSDPSLLKHLLASTFGIKACYHNDNMIIPVFLLRFHV